MAFKRVPIAYSVPSAQSNMPLYVKPSVMTGWGSLTLAEAQSSRWYADEDMVTQIAREITSADEIHHKMPTVPTSGGEVFTDYDGVRSDYAVTDTYGRNAVWGDYRAVYHMQGVDDSTAGGYNLTNNNSVAFNASKIENGADLGASNTNKKLSRSDTLGVNGSGTSLTLSTWIKLNTEISTGTYQFNYLRFQPLRDYAISYQFNGGTRRIRFSQYNNGSPENSTSVFHNITMGTSDWYHLALTYSWGGVLTGYVNGSSIGTTSPNTNVGTNLGRLFDIGAVVTSSYASVKSDEFRFNFTSALSANWITTEYNNQNDVASFWGTVTDAGGAPVANNGFMVWL